MTLRLGLCSVTLRHLDAAGVIEAAADAGLECVEWGADIHVPAGDEAVAADVRAATEKAGLAVASYGSYYRAGHTDPAAFGGVLRSAVRLGAPRIRIWAGAAGTEETSPDGRAAVIADTRRAGALAADAGIHLAFEFHRNTLTDGADRTLQLLDEIGRPDVRTYWQPPLDVPDVDALVGLDALANRVAAVHAFSWWPATTRHPLSSRAALWRAALDHLRGQGQPLDVLLEFVPDNDEKVLAREARTLRSLAAR
ncbi:MULTISPECIES: sugar phosphate isomerase/epimerase family protein [unclassified Streptomyces]|uniref:sugar phosphate isomerase/epimerase family protein n=1 Tax=unclassified Streptomyces TaxID=2593676 RepID=UPI0022509355|nr:MULTISPECIES: TIM barrel protein [unclassified Streptomyces]MCX5054721.1 sugar phosphate isomerase/epimerase [Streptomyces sp. NBC_00474]MCX5063298.1 sugar phosphate isomerase/epimerase [Streptomyces sp. NBC_00452]MCX5251139.1 sugar phosphate isomerase/epimerase [Streptomyces sp. NBC_00201]MCX5290932.1 sugar phosphate isomerase/epimerase [Streptomyces sp. NBC_00183]